MPMLSNRMPNLPHICTPWNMKTRREMTALHDHLNVPHVYELNSVDQYLGSILAAKRCTSSSWRLVLHTSTGRIPIRPSSPNYKQSSIPPGSVRPKKAWFPTCRWSLQTRRAHTRFGTHARPPSPMPWSWTAHTPGCWAGQMPPRKRWGRA